MVSSVMHHAGPGLITPCKIAIATAKSTPAPSITVPIVHTEVEHSERGPSSSGKTSSGKTARSANREKFLKEMQVKGQAF